VSIEIRPVIDERDSFPPVSCVTEADRP